MKQIIFLITLLFTITSNSQVGKAKTEEESLKDAGLEVVGEWKSINTVMANLIKIKVNDLDLYTFGYLNQDYFLAIETYQKISFYATQEELDYLFEELVKGFKHSKDYLKIDIGDGNIQYKGGVGMLANKTLRFITMSKRNGNGTGWLNGEGLHIIFNKPFDKKKWKAYLKS